MKPNDGGIDEDTVALGGMQIAFRTLSVGLNLEAVVWQTAPRFFREKQRASETYENPSKRI